MVSCPICGKSVRETRINDHIDSGCESFIETDNGGGSRSSTPVSSFFKTPIARREPVNGHPTSSPSGTSSSAVKRPLDTEPSDHKNGISQSASSEQAPKRSKPNALERAAPLAERMRPKTLDEVCGQSLVGPQGVLRGLIES